MKELFHENLRYELSKKERENMKTFMWLEENGCEYTGFFVVESKNKPQISNEDDTVLLVDGVKIQFDEPIHFQEEN